MHMVLVYLFQSLSGDSRVAELLEILSRRDGSLLPVFCESLVATGQPHVAEMLGFQGL